MSEKTLWKWLNKKMADAPGWSSFRFENCNSPGVPDSIIKLGGSIISFVELKDWSYSTRHPLTIEQKNFLTTFGGVVLVEHDEGVTIVNSKIDDLTPLLSCNVGYVKSIITTTSKNLATYDWLYKSIFIRS